MTRRPRPRELAARDESGKTYPLVLIEWIDSCYNPRWHTDDPEGEPTRCRSVGWLIHDGKDAKVVAPHIGDEDRGEIQRNGEMTIPTRSITRMRRLS